MTTKQYASGMRWEDIEEVREVLTGWTIEWRGRGSFRHLEVSKGDAEWIIQRRDDGTFRAHRVRRAVNPVFPNGQPLFDAANQLAILISARRAAEVVELLYRPLGYELPGNLSSAKISPEDIQRLLEEGRLRREERALRKLR